MANNICENRIRKLKRRKGGSKDNTSQENTGIMETMT